MAAIFFQSCKTDYSLFELWREFFQLFISGSNLFDPMLTLFNQVVVEIEAYGISRVAEDIVEAEFSSSITAPVKE